MQKFMKKNGACRCGHQREGGQFLVRLLNTFGSIGVPARSSAFAPHRCSPDDPSHQLLQGCLSGGLGDVGVTQEEDLSCPWMSWLSAQVPMLLVLLARCGRFHRLRRLAAVGASSTMQWSTTWPVKRP